MSDSEPKQPSMLTRFSQRMRRWQPNSEASDPIRLGRWIALVLAIYGVLIIGLGMYWSQTPDGFDTNETAAHYAAAAEQGVVTGSVTVSTLREVIRTLLEKPVAICSTIFSRLASG